MKKITYTFLLFSFVLAFGCTKSDFSPMDEDSDLAMLTVQVILNSHGVEQCGGPEVVQNVKVSLYSSEEDRKNRINTVATKHTLSRGAVNFYKLEGKTYFLEFSNQFVNEYRSVKVKKGVANSLRVAVNPDPDAG